MAGRAGLGRTSLQFSVIKNSGAQWGAAIAMYGGIERMGATLTFMNSVVELSNSAQVSTSAKRDGGALYVSRNCTVVMRDSVIRLNRSPRISAFAISLHPQSRMVVTAQNTSFVANKVLQPQGINVQVYPVGAALSTAGQTAGWLDLSLQECTFKDNAVRLLGGDAILFQNVYATTSKGSGVVSVRIRNTTIVPRPGRKMSGETVYVGGAPGACRMWL